MRRWNGAMSIVHFTQCAFDASISILDSDDDDYGMQSDFVHSVLPFPNPIGSKSQ